MLSKLLNHSCVMCRQTSTSVLCNVCLTDSETCVQANAKHPINIVDDLVAFTHANSITALGWYEWPINALIHLIKFKQRPDFCQLLSQWFVKYPLQDYDEPDALLALPASPIKQFFRGYNTPSLLTEHLCNSLKIENASSALTVANQWWSQHKRNREQRLAKQLVFTCKPLPKMFQRIVLIDDIVTTGATLKAAIAAIKGINPHINVDVWVIGITRPPSID